MPIFRTERNLIYFCHVPKCGGAAITRYLRERFGSVAFFNARYFDYKDPWNRTSPQHISSDDLSALFPASFFDFVFAVVRNPVDRMISEYHYLRDGHRKLPLEQSFSNWLTTLPGVYRANRFALDNHLRPMCEMVPSDATIFKLEDGLSQVVSYLDEICGCDTGPRVIERFHARDERIERVRATTEDVALIESLYSKDYDRFGYIRS
jgi:hypothetical protein